MFGPDYRYFYTSYHTPERAEEETQLIARLLELKPGAAVLDIPCGEGRIANRLAELGCRVVGVDRGSDFIATARHDAHARGVSVEYHCGDMREIQWTERFDYVINWSTSFGYFDDDANREVLRLFCRALRRGGRVLIEVIHPERFLNVLPPNTDQRWDVTEVDDDFMIDRFQYDAKTGIVETHRTILRDGQLKRYAFPMRTFTFPEIREWMTGVGFTNLDAVDETGERLRLQSKRLFVLAER